mmetsp:Transcript_3847/g.6811  ORF Transcript_3847/g.6811 Transcript_3847/m.6811 type:complete len:224 (-) Transcript_3847:1404-2075(-)
MCLTPPIAAKSSTPLSTHCLSSRSNAFILWLFSSLSFPPQNFLSRFDPLRLAISLPPCHLPRPLIQLAHSIVNAHTRLGRPHHRKVKHIRQLFRHVLLGIRLAQLLRLLHQLIPQQLLVVEEPLGVAARRRVDEALAQRRLQVTQSARFSPARQRIEVAEGLDAIVSVLSHGESECVSVAVDVDAVEGLVVPGGVALAPESVAGAGVVDSAAALEGGNDGTLT